MNKLKITTDYLNELKLSLQDEYDNSSVSPEDRYELKTIEEIDGVLEELRRVKEQGDRIIDKNKQDKFEDWMDNCPAFEKDCTDSWEENEEDGSKTLVYCYWFKVEGEE